MKVAERKIDARHRITLPESVMIALNLKAGDIMEIHLERNEVKLKVKKSTSYIGRG